MKHADESRYDRRAKADHHSEYRADRCGDAESGHREDGWSVRNGGGLPFAKREPKDGIGQQMRKSSLLHADREFGIILETTLHGKDKHDERFGYYETPCRLCQRL